MTACYDEGTLRAYLLRGEEVDAERAQIAAHLAGCEACQRELDELRAVEARVTAKLMALEPGQEPGAHIATGATQGGPIERAYRQAPILQRTPTSCGELGG